MHVFKGTTTIYHFRFSFARAAAKICRSGIRTKEKRTIEEGGSLLNARFFNSPIAREEFAIELFGFDETSAAYIQARFEAIRGRKGRGSVESVA